MNEEIITALQNMGFKRWTKGNFDRLYINPTKIGLYLEFYNTGNIYYAELNGKKISNCSARKMREAKCYIDIKTGCCVSGYDNFVCAMEELKKEAEEATNCAHS